MNRYATRIGLLLIALLAGTLSACTRSASTPPGTAGEGETTPQTSQQATMEAVRNALLTQTAQAGEAETGGEEEGEPTEAPAATSTPVVSEGEPTAAEPTYVEYTVQEGDWLFKIADQFDVDPQAIIDANNLTSPADLEPGVVLRIPTGETASAAPTTAATSTGGERVHVVKPGEWIWQIARQYGVDPQAIIDANNLPNPSLIYPGLELTIP